MNERQIKRPIGIWLAHPAETGTLSGVLSYSSPTEGVRFHSYGELMALLRRLAAVTASVNNAAIIRGC
jgi:hypothetical protein